MRTEARAIRPTRRPAAPVVVAVLALFSIVCASASAPSFAISRIVLEVAEIVTPGTPVGGAEVTLDLPATACRARARGARGTARTDRHAAQRAVRVHEILYVREPKIACREGKVSADGGPTKNIALNVSGEYDTNTKSATGQGSDLAVAGGLVQVSGQYDAKGWAVESRAAGVDIPQLRALVSPWFKAPATLAFTGHVDVVGRASDRGDGLQMAADFTTSTSTSRMKKARSSRRI